MKVLQTVVTGKIEFPNFLNSVQNTFKRMGAIKQIAGAVQVVTISISSIGLAYLFLVLTSMFD